MRFRVLFLAWLVVAAIAGASGAVSRLQPPYPQLVLMGLTAALVTAGATWPAFRAWNFSLSWHSIVAIHVSRFVGVYFIYLYTRGQLPYAWAVPAGIGDTLVAFLAAALLVTAAATKHPLLLLLWNALGFADIVMVVAKAALIGTRNPQSMSALTRLPLSLLPTFLVPIIIASHVLLFVQTRNVVRRVA